MLPGSVLRRKLVRRVRGLVSAKRYGKVVIDAAAVFLGYFAALAVRFEFRVPAEYFADFWLAAPVLVAVFLFVNLCMALYGGKWKYAGFDELLNLASASVMATALVTLACLLVPGARAMLPLSVAVMGGAVSLFLMAYARLQYRMFREMRLRRRGGGEKRVLLVGAGEAGEMVARDMIRHPGYGYSPVGFVDDDPRKRKLLLQGVPVLGGREDIPRLVKRHEIDEVFITIPSASGGRVREILPFCEESGARIKILPGILPAMAGDIGVAAVRELELEDLLGREAVETDLASIGAYITGKVVLVTGAGGSIGSELARQLAGLGPNRLLLLDNDETALFDLENELVRRLVAVPFAAVVADIRDAQRMLSVFRRYRPQVVFHSAALKHVPLMEYHPCEAVKNNVAGTRNLAEACVAMGAERFILVSTDKAVHPVNVMGASKRVAEMLVRGFNGAGADGRSGVLFAAVRFGNVLGSRGSVVPTFKRQIEGGGPVLVTHPEVTRYFMTIPEAAQLVIQAGAYTRGGDVFILDMGEPVKIMDLAREMVRLMGKEGQVEVRVTGLRPGEKLHEELCFPVEEMLRTPHPKIDRAVALPGSTHQSATTKSPTAPPGSAHESATTGAAFPGSTHQSATTGASSSPHGAPGAPGVNPRTGSGTPGVNPPACDDAPTSSPPSSSLPERIEALIAAAERDDEDLVRTLLSGLVPTYKPSSPRPFWGQPTEVPQPPERHSGGRPADAPMPHAEPGAETQHPHLRSVD